MCDDKANWDRTTVADRRASSASWSDPAELMIYLDPYVTENTKPNISVNTSPAMTVIPSDRSHLRFELRWKRPTRLSIKPLIGNQNPVPRHTHHRQETGNPPTNKPYPQCRPKPPQTTGTICACTNGLATHGQNAVRPTDAVSSKSDVVSVGLACREDCPRSLFANAPRSAALYLPMWILIGGRCSPVSDTRLWGPPAGVLNRSRQRRHRWSLRAPRSAQRPSVLQPEGRQWEDRRHERAVPVAPGAPRGH